MPDPLGPEEKSAQSSGPEPETTQAGPAGPEQDQAQAERRSRHDQAWAEFCEKLAAKAASLDPAAVLSQAMLMAASAPVSTMFAANQANALMFYNAVANQQKTNILGMSVTAKCVRHIFETGQTDDDDLDIPEQSPSKE